ncbi:cytochrome P450 [Bradyrhizobium aeschynomenes]|uniref:cytochrome P450 n=1 Tax=Bradyrhizobium aeschynomenes TaxID=2734909 RepID=UPI001552031C|nr:cytochrome P450 [Bradyrhizobium aeschynomenes]NPV24606.1 cytochrome P450 [Bradyrhizobium aeschynomenes]
MTAQAALRSDHADLLREARREAYSTPIEDFHPGAPRLFQNDTLWPWFERLRKEAPVHYCTKAPIEPYWSVTRYHDIMHVDTNHALFSSDVSNGGIMIRDVPPGYEWPSFIAMDEPRHGEQRKTVQPMFTPDHLDEMAVLIRQRSAKVLDSLPRNETFNWVEKVSIELTTQMLATLFDFPFEERRKLTRWSDVSTALPKSGIVSSEEERRRELADCAETFGRMWKERQAHPGRDLISMMAHSEATRHMTPDNLMGNLILLIVGGNDTTRNTMTASVLALNENPAEYQKLRDNPALIETMVPEVIRWQTPLAHMRRTALVDTELGGRKIRKGDRVVMWYVSGNRDGEVIENPDAFIIDRKRPRIHLSFGFGIHRCVGMRLAELQLRIVWEEIMKRFDRIEVVGEPKRVYSSFVRGYESLPVRIPG